MDKIEKIRQEIERQIKDPQEYCYGVSSINKLRELLDFIDTLESEKLNTTTIVEQIKAEIERLYNGEAPKHDQQCNFDDGYFTGIDAISQFIDTLEPEKPVPADLEEYASRAGFDYVDDIEVNEPGHRWNDHDVEYAYRDGIIAGAKWQKKQMMKKAVDGKVRNIIIHENGDEVHYSITYPKGKSQHSINDKVKIIIL